MVGYVGADVPVELITAAGAVPLRLAGDPSWDLAPGARILGDGVDPVASAVLSGLLAGAYPLDLLVVSRDCEASLRLFYAVRELRRLSPSCGLPEAYLVDIGHLPQPTTTAYNTVRIGQFRAWLGSRILSLSDSLSDDAVAAAIAAHDEQRRLLAEVAAWRLVGLSGSAFLGVVGAGTAMPVAAHVELLKRLLAEARPDASGTRAFLTGSGHDTPHVYRAIEARNVTIVGEDHDWGDLWFALPVGPSEQPEQALAERYQHNGPTATRATVRERADHTAARARECGAELLICYARRRDDAPRWDFAAQAAATGLLAWTLFDQPYGGMTT